MTKFRILLLSFVLLFLNGCAALLATSAVVGTDMVTDRRTAGIYIEDQNIELKASSALSDDSELADTADINATSFNRVVLITGQAPTADMKRRASSIVRQIDNVKTVHNEIKVIAPDSFLSSTGDAWITTKAKSLLLAEDELASHHIKVITENGDLFLMGLVTRDEAAKTIAVVREIDGVESVVEVFEYID